MSDNAQYAFQANFKFGPQYKETLVNVPANTPDEMLSKLDWLTTNAAKFVAAHEALHAASGIAPLAGNVTSTQVINDAPAAAVQAQQQAQQGWGGAPQQGQQAPPSWAQPAAQGPGPTCQHGPMVHRSGNKNGRDWSAHFCPTPKGTPGQCQPVFGK